MASGIEIETGLINAYAQACLNASKAAGAAKANIDVLKGSLDTLSPADLAKIAAASGAPSPQGGTDTSALSPAELAKLTGGGPGGAQLALEPGGGLHDASAPSSIGSVWRNGLTADLTNINTLAQARAALGATTTNIASASATTAATSASLLDQLKAMANSLGLDPGQAVADFPGSAGGVTLSEAIDLINQYNEILAARAHANANTSTATLVQWERALQGLQQLWHYYGFDSLLRQFNSGGFVSIDRFATDPRNTNPYQLPPPAAPPKPPSGTSLGTIASIGVIH